MRYSHYSYLPIGAFEPVLGKIKLYGGGGGIINWVSDQLDEAPSIPEVITQPFQSMGNSSPLDVFSNMGNVISDTVSNAVETVGDVGNQIDQSVNDNVPGGWVLPAAVAVAVVAPELLPELAPEIAEGTAAEELASAAPEIVNATAAEELASAAPELADAVAPDVLAPEIIAPDIVAPEITPNITPDIAPQDLADALRDLPSETLTPDINPVTTDIVSNVSEINPNVVSDIATNDVITPDVITSTTPDIQPQDLADALRSEGTAQLGSGTSLSADAATNPLNPYYSVANPEVQANLGTVSNLVGGGAESNLAILDTLSNPLIPTTGAGIGGSELGATGSIIGSGQGLGVQTLPETLAPTGLNGLTPNDLMSQPTNIANPSVTASDLADALKKMNQIKNLFSTQTQNITKNQQSLQSNQALSNMLRASQKTPFEVPKEYRASNPFGYVPEQPIQDSLASLLRNNYGKSF